MALVRYAPRDSEPSSRREQRIKAPLATGERRKFGQHGAAKGQQRPPWAGTGFGAWRGSKGGDVAVYLEEGIALEQGAFRPSRGGKNVIVEVDPERGPIVGTKPMRLQEGKQWQDIPTDEQKLLVYKAAKANGSLQAALREEREKRLAREAREAQEAEAQAKAARWAKLVNSWGTIEPRERCCLRCEVEADKPSAKWDMIGHETVMNNHDKLGPGMFYGIEFPWSEDMLFELGPTWLTQAFHCAGTLSPDNRVTKIIPDGTKVTGGNNAGKFLFEVRYEKKDKDLHEKLFAKVPFPFSEGTKNDRLSSSVNKQPMDFYELNTYRLLESVIPVPIPKYYYADICNTTSNCILITERVDFKEIGGKIGEIPLQPFDIEGPYEKCKDFCLRGQDKEYYMTLMHVHAKIAGLHKAGKLGTEDFLRNAISFAPTDPQSYGINEQAATGGVPQDRLSKIDTAIKFFAGTAKVLFPAFVQTDTFQEKFKSTMMLMSAYNNEINFWKHSNPDYVAIGHMNLNIDNAYFWRDEKRTLDCGIFDFGGFGSNSLPHKLYWGFNCAEFDQVKMNLDDYISMFVTTYHEYGGPKADKEVVKNAIILTAFQNLWFMVVSVPDCLRQCPAKEWDTIKDRHDPRVAENVGGKSTLRTTLQAMLNGLRILEELNGDKVVAEWVENVWCRDWGRTRKTDAMIYGDR